VGQEVAKFGHVVGQALISVGQAGIHVAHTVVSLIVHVLLVRVLNHARSEGDGQLALEVLDHAVFATTVVMNQLQKAT
jgi:hypothetical protein